ncbi:MAG: SRPBCC family protein [Reichenbachiella sp.]
MKAIVIAIVSILTINTNIMATKGFEVQKEITINVPASQLWEMVGPGFTEVYKWSSNVDHSVGKGTAEFEGAVCSERHCDLNVKGFSSINEKLTKYDDARMNLAYEVNDGMPGFVTKAVNDWTVVAVSDTQSKLIMKGEFGIKGIMGFMMNGMMEKKMNETLETVLEDAKIYAETGMISITKQERITSLDKKSKKAA